MCDSPGPENTFPIGIKNDEVQWLIIRVESSSNCNKFNLPNDVFEWNHDAHCVIYRNHQDLVGKNSYSQKIMLHQYL